MAKTLGEQLLAVTMRRSRHAVSHSTRCNVCGKLLSNDATQGDRPMATESDTGRTLVFGLTVLIGLPMLCGGLYLLANTLVDAPNSRSNAAIVNRCQAPHE
jgi:hypothetical protein